MVYVMCIDSVIGPRLARYLDFAKISKLYYIVDVVVVGVVVVGSIIRLDAQDRREGSKANPQKIVRRKGCNNAEE